MLQKHYKCRGGHRRHVTASIARIQIDLGINMSGSQSSSHQFCHQQTPPMSLAAFFSCVIVHVRFTKSLVARNRKTKNIISCIWTDRDSVCLMCSILHMQDRLLAPASIRSLCMCRDSFRRRITSRRIYF